MKEDFISVEFFHRELGFRCFDRRRFFYQLNLPQTSSRVSTQGNPGNPSGLKLILPDDSQCARMSGVVRSGVPAIVVVVDDDSGISVVAHRGPTAIVISPVPADPSWPPYRSRDPVPTYAQPPVPSSEVEGNPAPGFEGEPGPPTGGYPNPSAVVVRPPN